MEWGCGMKGMISVVIPVYNVKEYLEECIKSVLNSTYENLEILLVDDGSTDGSGEICDQYAMLDSRIKVFHQENKGVVTARNVGISNAHGEYIAFVDADDWVDRDMYQTLVVNIGNCDLITSGYVKKYADVEIETYVHDSMPEGLYKGKEDMEFLWKNMIYWKDTIQKGVYPFLWNKLFRRNIVESYYKTLNPNIRFGEDGEFIYSYLMQCSSIRIMHQAFYFYRVRQESASRAADKNFLGNMSELYIAIEKIFANHYMRDEIIPQWERKVVQLVAEGFKYKMQFRGGVKEIYGLPYGIELNDKKIVLYGAGRVGCEYFQQIKELENCEVVLWIDKNFENISNKELEIKSVDAIKDSTYNQVILAVEKEELARTMKANLLEMGVEETRILWKEPIRDISL